MADRYWVGGTASWDGTAGTKWSATSGGPGGASVPTSADDVFFNASSTGTVTIATGNTGAKSITCTGFTGTLAGGAAITVSGGITLVAGMTYSHTGAVTIAGTGTITSAGKTFSAITINGSGITATLGDALLVTNALTVTQGTFTTASFNVTCGTFSSSNSNTRTINLASSTVTITAQQQSAINIGTVTNLTFSAGTSQINLSGAQFSGLLTGAITFNNVSFTGSGATSTTGSNLTCTGTTFNNLTLIAPNASGTKSYGIGSPNNFTVTGTFTSSGASPSRRCFIDSGSAGSTITAAAISATDCDFRGITLAGAAAGAAPTRAGDGGLNSGIVFPAAKNVYRVGTNTTWAGSSSWALSSNGTGDDNNFPLAQDTAYIDNATTGSSLTFVITNCGGLNLSSRTTAYTLTFVAGMRFFGDVAFSSSTTLSGSVSAVTFSKSGSVQTLTSAGRTIPFAISVGASTNLKILDAFTCNFTGGVSISINSNATFDANGYNVTIEAISVISTDATIAFGSGTWTNRGGNTTGQMVNITSTTLTVTGTAIMNCTYAGASARTVVSRTTQANSISYNFTAGTYNLTFLAASDVAGNVDFTGFAGTLAATGTGIIYGNLKLSTGMTLTASTSELRFGATSGTQDITSNGKTIDFPITFNGAGGTFKPLDALTVGSTRTATLTAGTLDLSVVGLSTGLFVSSGSTTRSIAFGTNVINVTGNNATIVDVGGTNFSYIGTFNITSNYTGSTGTRTFTAGLIAAGTYPNLATSGSQINIGTAATDIVALTGSWGNVDFTNYTRTLANSTRSIFGNLTVSTGMTLAAGANTTTFAATSGTQDITSNGKTMNFPVTFNGAGGTFRLLDAMTTGLTRTVTHTNGTLNLNGNTLTVGTSYTTATGTKNLTFNGGTLVCPAASSTAFNNAQPTNFTTTAGTGTGKISMTAATAKTFVGGGSSYNCTLSNDGAGALTITGSNTFANLTATTLPSTIFITSATTQTFTNFTLQGTPGNLVTLNATTTSAYTLSKPGSAVATNYLSISYCTANAGEVWYVGINSTDGGNNTNLKFSNIPPPTATVTT